jgi:hypothetical protein
MYWYRLQIKREIKKLLLNKITVGDSVLCVVRPEAIQQGPTELVSGSERLGLMSDYTAQTRPLVREGAQ